MTEQEPEPIQTVKARTGPLTMIIRRWTNRDGESCRLCSHCTFQPGEDGTGLCILGTNDPVLTGTEAEYGDRP